MVSLIDVSHWKNALANTMVNPIKPVIVLPWIVMIGKLNLLFNMNDVCFRSANVIVVDGHVRNEYVQEHVPSWEI